MPPVRKLESDRRVPFCAMKACEGCGRLRSGLHLRPVLTANLLVVTGHGLELSFTRQRQPVPGTDAEAHIEREAQAGGTSFLTGLTSVWR
jgi:hypothetical protein